MKSSNKNLKELEEAFNDIFSFADEKDQLEIDAKILMAKFLSQIQETADEKGLKRNELASEIGTSASYLTQLFRGHKLMNLITAAKLQKALGIEFDIKIAGKDKFANPINEDTIADHLDKWYESNRTGSYLKVVRNLSTPRHEEEGSEYEYSVPTSKSFAS
ncbi:helix-turn-helix domain-containing protein [Fluviicola taffensis]|nr:helix-turn-helix transcriptional regulator [Fluviicola taffensis]